MMQPTSEFENETVVRADYERQIRLDVEVLPCLITVLTKYDAAKVLTDIDFLYLTRLFETLGIELDRKRVETVEQIADMPGRAARDPSVLVPVGPFVKRHDEFLAESRKRLSEIGYELPAFETRREQRLQYQIELTQKQIAADYRLSASQSILKVIRGVQWPEQKLSQ